MRLLIYSMLPVWLLLVLSLSARADHLVGGQVEMQDVGDRQGHFKVTITIYYETSAYGARFLAAEQGYVFRKRDNQPMFVFNTSETKARTRVIYSNPVCASQSDQQVGIAFFDADIQLDPDLYDDPGGYYISYQTSARNERLNNIINPAETGFTFYLEFPALKRSGSYQKNSSPHFEPINGELICVNQPFVFSFGGTDTDGDELRYSMVNPLNSKTIKGGNGLSGPYLSVDWLTGFSAEDAIPGMPSLRVDAKTGELSVTANRVGLFVFAINVEEFRNGVKIGEVHRDFQFQVIDCPAAAVLAPKISISGYSVTAVKASLCNGNSLTLVSETNPNWQYQWRRDGMNLSDATSSVLIVKEAGVYSVLVSLKNTCNQPKESLKVTISLIDTGNPFAIQKRGQLCANGGTVRLEVPQGGYDSFQWLRDGNVLAGQTADFLLVNEPGQYALQALDLQSGCRNKSESLTISRSPVLTATLRPASGRNELCPGEILLLEAGGGVRYQWQKDNQTIPEVSAASYTVNVAGTYSLTALDENGCMDVPPPVVISALPSMTVTMDSVPRLCGSHATAIQLTGSPAGGIFSGPGVTGTMFSPVLAGVGRHVLTYAVKAAPQCDPVKAQRTAIVSPGVTIDFPDTVILFSTSRFRLEPVIGGGANWFQWQPATYLSRADIGQPELVNINPDGMTYQLEARNEYGCSTRDTVTIIVRPIWVPDAFSPNKDGVNDVWVLPGIASFPEAEVKVFNRWGTIIYWSDKGYTQPFDGYFEGVALEPGPYPYVIRPAANIPEMRGTVSILR
ncbi:gliding motility-associated C-terminal domain-containing protein [Arsenicibacter rosenii]|uniref:Ig-like domain-containing protein n=1 Tax=Arsenicibacter rosenii TaxID=1750698 RepID=A0A1S2VDR9_9BACT|nr:gliding motility-associated C-terminal domain-containing protein [Arsenicibacter rosenii]OIN56849.1 hypothetical protein BLX24_23035 [Arsenicibacter rosenii]